MPLAGWACCPCAGVAWSKGDGMKPAGVVISQGGPAKPPAVRPLPFALTAIPEASFPTARTASCQMFLMHHA